MSGCDTPQAVLELFVGSSMMKVTLTAPEPKI